jgi:hypothetical protein
VKAARKAAAPQKDDVDVEKASSPKQAAKAAKSTTKDDFVD